MELLGFSQGDEIWIRGKMFRDTVCQVYGIDTYEVESIGMNSVVRSNIRVKVGDNVKVYKCDIELGKEIEIAPMEDTIEAATEDLIDTYLTPYLLFRPMRLFDCFIVSNDTHDIEFKVTRMVPSPCCIVSRDTKIICRGEPARREDEKDLLGYDDVGGVSKQMADIRVLVEVSLRNPQLFTLMGVKPPKGFLMCGPPGSGKRLLARAMANESLALLYCIDAPRSEWYLSWAFKDAEKNAPAIIFIDHIDSIASKQDKTNGKLLRLLDNLKSGAGIIVIGATYRPNSIDPALRRFGRLDREMEIDVPDVAGRLEVLRIHTNKWKNMKLSTDVDLESIAKITHGYVGADLAALCNEAALVCITGEMDEIGLEDEEIPKCMAVTDAHFKAALSTSKPSALREIVVEDANVSWNDIGGLDTVKREIQETVQYPFMYHDKFGMSPSQGVLFYGSPGCGKTLLAKAVANDCHTNFISIKGPELLTMWLGESEANLRRIFDKAGRLAPCIVFFDELDSMATRRGGSVGDIGGPADKVLNQLLLEMDGRSPKKIVFVIGATNQPTIIDSAILRSGRLNRLIYVPFPDESSRHSIFVACLQKSPVSDVVDLGTLAKNTGGYSGADIMEICQRACKFAIREDIMKDIERERRRSENPKTKNEDVEDAVSEITTAHFEESMKSARRSVSEADIKRHQSFAKTFKQYRRSIGCR